MKVKETITKEDVKEYAEDGGMACPWCNSERLEPHGMDGDRKYNYWYQDVYCRDCGRTWREQYEIRGITPLTIDGDDEQDAPEQDTIWYDEDGNGNAALDPLHEAIRACDDCRYSPCQSHDRPEL